MRKLKVSNEIKKKLHVWLSTLLTSNSTTVVKLFD